MTPETATFADIVLWIVALTSLVNFSTSIWSIFSGPSKRNAIRLDEQSVTLAGLDRRVGAVEQAMLNGPSQRDFNQHALNMQKLSGQIDTMNERLSGHVAIMQRLEATVARHDEHLQKGG